MGDGSGYAEAYALFASGQPGKESSFAVVVEWTAEGVAHVVAEGADAVELGCMGLGGQLVGRVGAGAGAPSLAIDIDGGIDLVHSPAYLVHGLDVVDAHEVEPETVDVVLVDPVAHRLYHKLSHERFLARCLVAAA